MYTSLNIAISLKRTSFSTPASLWVNLWRHWSDANFICEVTSLSLAGVPITSFLRWAKPRFIHRIGFLFTKIIFGSSDMSWWRLACLSLGSVCISSFYKNFRNEHFVREAKKNTKSHTWCVSFLRFGFLEKQSATHRACEPRQNEIICVFAFSPQLRLKPNGFGCSFSPNSVVTLGVLTVIVKAGVARSRWRTGVGRISSLFSWFRACMFVSSVNFRSFRVAATDAHGFCL